MEKTEDENGKGQWTFSCGPRWAWVLIGVAVINPLILQFLPSSGKALKVAIPVKKSPLSPIPPTKEKAARILSSTRYVDLTSFHTISSISVFAGHQHDELVADQPLPYQGRTRNSFRC